MIYKLKPDLLTSVCEKGFGAIEKEEGFYGKGLDHLFVYFF